MREKRHDKVLLVEDTAPSRYVVGRMLTDAGFEVIEAKNGKEAIDAAQNDPDLVVLDINLGSGQPSGIDAYDWLMSEHFGGRLLFLTGHAHAHPLVARAEQLRRAQVLDKPLDGQVLLDTIIGSSGGAEAV